MRTATEMAAALSAGHVTAAELTETALGRIAERDAQIHAFIASDPAEARRAARASDARRRAGQSRGPLDGIPIAVKDNLAVSGFPRSGGTGAFRDQPSAQDATAVARLRAAGAVILGTLNMHEGALGATTDNPFWGRCENPTVPGHTPGGSSGGSAAAVAADFVPISLGTDTMGSVRIPAAYCGLWGLKPTRGLIPVTGLLHLSWTLDSIGPLAHGPEDLEIALRVMMGGDGLDVMANAAPPDERQVDPGSLVVAVPPDALLESCEAEVRAAHLRSVHAARALGARIVPFTLDWPQGRLRRAGLLISEVEAASILETAIAARPEGFSDGFRAAIAYGRDAAATRVALAYRLLAETTARTVEAMRGVDAVLMPAAPQRAFIHDMPAPADQADFTALANVAGLPALVLPLSASDGGAPCSAQLLGRPGHDLRLIALGRLLHERLIA